jgi:hypothetical protein
MMKPESHSINFKFIFAFDNGEKKIFDLQLDDTTLEFIGSVPSSLPEWTKLEYNPCSNCPLIGKVQYCPVAVNLSSIVESFRDIVSYETALVSLETTERTYVKRSTVQKGLSSIIGILMVTSNCPIMDELRPMTRFHLPFATSEETLFRVISYYLTRQYFVMKEGQEPDWELKKLSEIYKQVSEVNLGFSKRIKEASQKDANVNALVILHTFGGSISYFVENGLDQLKYLFQKYL